MTSLDENMKKLLKEFGLAEESQVDSFLSCFSICSVMDKVNEEFEVGPGKRKTALFLASCAKSVGKHAGENIFFTHGMEIYAEEFFGKEICSDARRNPNTKHKTLQLLFASGSSFVLTRYDPSNEPL